MADGNHILKREEFVEASIRLLKTLNVDEKHSVLFEFERKEKMNVYFD